ncbi:MAG: hypothetical protein EA422_11520 [Gemmatimonadales bacterium]|nr:MAG: hypothetical protein EA422_11520 [Gemmatimonadales bacterium]
MLGAVEMALADAGYRVTPEIMDRLLLLEHTPIQSPASDLAEAVLLNPGILGVVGHSGSSGSLMASPIYNRAQVVQIAPTSTAPIYSETGPFSFRLVPSDEVQGAFLADVVNGRFPQGTRLAVFYANDDYGRSLRAEFLQGLDPERADVVLQAPHVEAETRPFDAEAAVASLQLTGAEVVLWFGRPPELDHLLPSLRAALGEIPVLGSDALSRAEIRTELHPAWRGVEYADFMLPDPDRDLFRFLDRYRARTGVSGGMPEALAYDAASLLLQAVAEGARSGEEIRRYLLRLGRDSPPFPGLTGPIQFTDEGDMMREFTVRQVRMPGEEG